MFHQQRSKNTRIVWVLFRIVRIVYFYFWEEEITENSYFQERKSRSLFVALKAKKLSKNNSMIFSTLIESFI